LKRRQAVFLGARIMVRWVIHVAFRRDGGDLVSFDHHDRVAHRRSSADYTCARARVSPAKIVTMAETKIARRQSGVRHENVGGLFIGSSYD
jgi:hypothetical protein